jgi:amino acid transporter
VLAIVLCFAEASSHFDEPGSAYLFALARAGFGPRFLASIHPRFRTPAAALFTQTAIALPLALSGSFVGLATLSVVARLITYLATATAGSFRLPGGLAIPAIATTVSLLLLANASWTNLAAAAAAALVGGVIYRLQRAAV